MTLQAPPTATSTAVRGLGIVLTRQDAATGRPVVLGRRILSTVNLSPRLQFVLVRNRAGSPDFYALLHNNTANTILRQSLNASTDPNAEAAPTTWITVSAIRGRAMAALDHSTLGLTAVWSEATVADRLGVSIHDGLGAHVSAGATITGTALGFTASQRANGRFTGFVAREREDGMIVVLAGMVDMTTPRTSPGDFTGYSMVTFVLDPSVVPGPGAIVQTHQVVDVDVPFDPHQLAEGMPTPLNGLPATRKLWCAGRSDAETWIPSTPGITAGNEGPHCMAAEGIWICTADDLESLSAWRRIHVSAVGVSHDVRGHTRPAGLNPTRGQIPRDIGLAYDEAWQRLTLLGIDTDPSQDPVLERPTY